MAHTGAGEKLKVFISYSRKDSAAFADELLAGLEVAGFAPSLDRHDIVPGEPWEARLGRLIEQSDTVVFVVSPEAVKSDRCTWEVERTLELSKRLLPVIFKSVPDHDIPEKLRRLQYVPFHTGTGFARPLSQLAEALRVDLEWIREHTRLGEIAMRWDSRGRPESLLLRGDDVDAAKAWIAAHKAEAPGITDAQRAFIKASEEAEATRFGKERAQLEARARQQRLIAWLLGGVAALVLAMIGYVTWESYDVARREMNVFTARATDALNEEKYDLAMRYALQAYQARGRFPWTTPFSTELEAKLAGGALSTRLHRLLNRAGRAVAFSKDGKWVVTASEDNNTARIWDAESGNEIAVLKGHALPVASAAFSADGTRVLTVSYDHTARTWDAQSGKGILVKDHAPLDRAAFSGDGKRVVTASHETARIWDADSGEDIAVLKGHTESVLSAAFSADGTRVVTASNDKTARIWNAESGKEVAVLKGHDFMRSAVFSPDGRRVLTTSYEYTPRIWDAESGKEIAVLKGHTNFISTSAAFSRDGKRVLTASNDNTARIWDAESGKEITVLNGHTGPVRSAAFSANGKWVVTASEDNTARIWDAESGNQIAVLKGHALPVRRAAFSADGKRVLTASEDNTTRIWNAESSNQIAVLKGHAFPVRRAAFSGEGKRVVTASYDDTARIWDVEGGREVAVLKAPSPVLIAAFSGDGKQVVTGSFKTTQIWDAETGAEIAVLEGHDDYPEAFSANGRRMVTISRDGARIWDVESGKEIIALKVDYLKSAAFSADGKQLVTGSWFTIARIWDVESGKEIALLDHPGSVESAAFTTDGKQVVTASFKTAIIWRTSSKTDRYWDRPGEDIAVLKGHTGTVRSAAFSADGTRVVTASEDGTARIWDVESGKEIAILKGHTGPVLSAALSADGTRVVTASEDNTARIWDVTWATLVRGDDLRERVCAEKLIGGAQEFTDSEIGDDPILRGIDKDDPIARNPCLRRGPLSLDYWSRLPGQLWRSTRKLVGVD